MQRIAVLAAALAGGALIAAACGGSGAKPAASTTASAASTAAAATPRSGTPVPGNTAVAIVGSPFPTYTPKPYSGAEKTAISQGAQVPLAEFRDPKGRFTVGLPIGWTIASDVVGVSASLGAPGTIAIASLGVACSPGATVAAQIAADRSLLKNVGSGDLTLDKEFSTTVDGITAREIPWQGVAQATNVLVKHWYVYFEAKGCAWRLLLNTYPGANEQEMLTIFRRVLDSFRLQ
ncbi:MAG: hypothetical protein KGK07_13150 [Chloroflexota bacterium]|nr:hypothetical protein [Chloroflexota bacterium]